VLDPVTWAVVMERVAALPASASPTQAIHRDLNPGNVLWWRRRPSGIVDWVHLCAGPAEEDIGRCRVNIWLLAGRGAADAFLAEVHRLGVAYDPVWDLAAIADMAPHLHGMQAANRLGARLTPDLVHERAEEIVLAGR
jgi:aminoglycoside phosphotransferase (APT) family kinase protein